MMSLKGQATICDNLNRRLAKANCTQKLLFFLVFSKEKVYFAVSFNLLFNKMNIMKLKICLLAVVLLGCSKPGTDNKDAFVQELFRNPENTYRSVPFYSLNDHLEEGELKRQLGLMKEGGFGGAFLHSRIGLLTPYLSDEWFRMMDAGLKTCQELGIDAWYYDEDKWPSGFAGGIIPLQNADFQARSLLRMTKDYVVKAPDALLFEDDNYKYVCRVDPMGQEWFNGTSWVDLMNPAMVKAFIDCSYEPYIERYAGHEHSIGIFTDEPQVSPRADIPHKGMVSYSPVMDHVFKERCGYDLYPAIPSLFDSIGDFRKIRLDYYRTVAYCMEQAFSKQIGAYCKANNFIWTGHYNGEDTPTATMLNEGNLMQQLRHMQQPGIDALGLRFQTIYCAKGASSVANQYGIERRLSELFGISGHNMSFEDRMWITSWHTIMGINFMCPHLYLYSMKGERKRDFPPTISHQQPYWTYNQLFEDFSARLCYFATIGQPVAELCVFHPLESSYIEYMQGKAGRSDNQYAQLLNQLMTTHRNFDIGDEQIISEIAKIENGRFVVGAMKYKIMLLPEMATIRQTTLDLLKKFADAGGAVVVYNNYPRFVEGEKNEAAIEALKKSSTLVTKESLEQAINEKATPDFNITGEGVSKIYTHLRTVSNGASLQLSNTSRTDTYRISLAFDSPRTAVALWNPVSGECLKLIPDADGRFTIEFAPAQTWIVTTGASAKEAKFDATYTIPGARTRILTLDNTWTGKRIDPNAITLDFASFSTDEGKHWSQEEPVLAFYDRTHNAPKPFNGPLLIRYNVYIDDLPGSCVLGLEQPEMYRQITVNGHEVKFTGNGFFIDAAIKTQDIRPFLQVGDNRIVLSLDYVSPVNSLVAAERYGTEIESIYLAGDFAVYGVQTDQPLTTTWYNRTPNLAKKPLVTGYKSFRMASEQNLFRGDLSHAGYPFFAGRFELANTFDLSAIEPDSDYKLVFPGFEAILIAVTVNGVEMPVLFASPWEVDITKALKTGKNEITVTLTNSLRNLMGPHHHKGGELTEVGPSSFRASNGWPNIIEKGEWDWYDARLRGNPILWRDDYYVVPFGILQAPELQKIK